ncbi:MAG: RNA methyltransferase [Burkholderiales bacterium]|jgi:tRNA/rRNA methyltransferase|nr:RNA methyltransferase [Burkholderiales bacterium]
MEDAPAPTLARLAVVLVATSHPGNVGASARAMLAMGLDRLVLVSPGRFPDPEATARAAGANDVLERARIAGTLDAALDGVACSIGFTARPREFAGTVLSAREAAGFAVASLRAGRKAAFVFGNEMSGLSNDELARCTAVATIAANPAMSSLNLAAAVQVAVYEARVAAHGDEAWRAPRFAPATHEAIEGLVAHAERTFVAMRFLHPGMPRRLMPRLRRLFARAGLEREEVNILRGILARVDQLIGKAR